MENFLYNVSERSTGIQKLTTTDLVTEVTMLTSEADALCRDDIDDCLEEVLWENTVKELSARLRTAGIRIPRGARKADLIDLTLVHGLAYANDSE